MGVLKNDVGRPSNKTIMIRRILKILALSLIGIIAFTIGFYQGYIKENKINKDNKNISKKKVDINEAKKILNKYSINDSVYWLSASQLDQNYKILLAIENTKPNKESNICKKVAKNNHIEPTKDKNGDYIFEGFVKNDDAFCNDENDFYSYNELEKQYKKLFGQNVKLPIIKYVDNSIEFELYAYTEDPNGYVQLQTNYGGFVMDGEKEYIYDAYLSNNEMHIVFSSFFYIDNTVEGKLNVYFSEEIDRDDIDNNLSLTESGKIDGDVEQFFIKNRNRIPVYEMILTKEKEDYIYKSINKVK